MEVAKPELLGVVDDDRIGVGHVDAALHDTGGYQYVILIIHEIEDDLLQHLRLHLPVPHGYPCVGDFPPYQGFHLVNVLDTVVDEEHLPVPAHLEIDRFPDDIGVETLHLRLHGITVGRWRGDAGKIPGPHQGEL